MATIETIRPDLPATLPLDPAAFRAGRPEEERLTDLLAFALVAEAGDAAAPERVEQARRQAEAALSDHAVRYLHNNIERIRHEAAAEAVRGLRGGPRFGTLLLANLVALAIAAAIGGWLALHPETLAGLAGQFPG